MDESAVTKAKAIASLLAGDAGLQRRAAGFSCAFMLQIGDTQLHTELTNGALDVVLGPMLMRSWRFALRGDADAWSAFWQPNPPPGFHDVFALTKAKRFTLEGDLYPFMSRLLFFKDLLALPRRLGASS